MRLVKGAMVLAVALSSGMAMAQKAGETLDVSKYVEFKDTKTPYLQKMTDKLYSYYDGGEHVVSNSSLYLSGGQVIFRTTTSPMLGKESSDNGVEACKKELEKAASFLSKQYKNSFKENMPVVNYTNSRKGKMDTYFFSDSPLKFEDLRSEGSTQERVFMANVPFAQMFCMIGNEGSQIKFIEEIPNSSTKEIMGIVYDFNKKSQELENSKRDIVPSWRGVKLGNRISSYGNTLENSYMKSDEYRIPHGALWEVTNAGLPGYLNVIAKNISLKVSDYPIKYEDVEFAWGLVYRIDDLTKEQCIKHAISSMDLFSKTVGFKKEINSFNTSNDFEQSLGGYYLHRKNRGQRFNVYCKEEGNSFSFVELLEMPVDKWGVK